MKIIIDGQEFTFSDDAEVKVASGGYDLDIVEPGFDKTSEVFKGGGTSKPIKLPAYIECRIVRCRGMEPCSRVYKDKNGKLRFTAYFD